MLNFIQKGASGGNSYLECDVSVNTKGKTAYTISFDIDSIKTINNGTLPKSLMVAEQDNKIYFVPCNRVSGVAFALYTYHSDRSNNTRCNIQINKTRINLDKYEGRYNFHYDEKETAYYIDRRFLLT